MKEPLCVCTVALFNPKGRSSGPAFNLFKHKDLAVITFLYTFAQIIKEVIQPFITKGSNAFIK